MASQSAPCRRTRIVCISDTHNCTVKIPKGDVLIHCGDLTNTGSFKELQKQITWLEAQPHECKIVIAGNHDLTLDSAFFDEFGGYSKHHEPQDTTKCQALLTESKSLTYLKHEFKAIRLSSPLGPRTKFTIFGSPYSPEYGSWAFQYKRHSAYDLYSAHKIWADIPIDTDILVTHGPSHGHRDETNGREAAGCEALREAMWRIRPRLQLCGHIHEARGVERVRWNLESKGVKFMETATEAWTDPAPTGDKLSLVDLTAKGGRPLDNDGSKAELHDVPDGGGTGEDASPGIGSRGLGGDPDSARSDRPALVGRLGRKETCVINCAIQATGYPHHGPRKLNKAIVVDIELPVWQD